MGRWLARLENDKKNGNIPDCVPTKLTKGGCVSSVSSESGIFQKKKHNSGRWLSKVKNSSVNFVGSKSVPKQKINRPKVWCLKIKTGDAISSMTVIDPARLNDDDFRKSQELVFGKNRIIDLHERSTLN